jgi:hypothetical protein
MATVTTRALLAPLTKAANPYASQAGMTADRNDMISAGLDDVAKAVLLAGAAGVGLRGLSGVGTMFGRGRPSLVSNQTPAMLEIPHPVLPPAEAARRKKLLGAAGTGMKAAAEHTEGLNPIGNALGMYQDPATGAGGGFLSGHGASPTSEIGKAQMPWYLPAVAGGTLVAGVGGYKAMDWLLNKKRKMDLDAELSDARADFQKALVSQYDPKQLRMLKQGSASDQLAADLDLLADRVVGREKTADDESLADRASRMLGSVAEPVTPNQGTVKSVGGTGLGAYAAIAGLTALGSGYLANQYFSKTDPNRAVAEAIKKREAMRWSTRPPEIFAVPVPVKPSALGE